MFSYIAYGLGIHSSLPLPELLTGKASADVFVRLGKVDRLWSRAAGEGTCFQAFADEACLARAEVGVFLVREGREIVIDPAPGVEERVLRLFILGPALAVLLHQRGRLVLHASAVAVDGGAIAFLGGPGWGKSTMAAALYARGHELVADDVTAIDLDGDDPMVPPGFPQLKLWPDTAVSLGRKLETLPRLHSQLEKRACRVMSSGAPVAMPLRRIYVLDEGTDHAIEPIRGQDALMELVRHSYAARLLQQVNASMHFLQCANLANKVPVRRLKRLRSLSALPELAQIVEEDFAQLVC